MPIVSGYYDHRGTPVPRVLAYIYFLRFKNGRWIRFLVDTGASQTSIHPSDWLFIVPQQEWFTWPTDHSSQGISGSRAYAIEPAIILFRANGESRLLASTLQVVAVSHLMPQDLSQPIPSLLGMDLLADSQLSLKPSDDLLTIDVPGTFI